MRKGFIGSDVLDDEDCSDLRRTGRAEGRGMGKAAWVGSLLSLGSPHSVPTQLLSSVLALGHLFP